MWSDVLRIGFGISLLAGMFRIATPILFVALGELVSERAGVRNLGVEGTMLTGAFLGFLVASKGDSLWLGVAAAALAGAFMGALMAVLAASLKVDQTVAGLALNLFASGITFFWYRVAFQGPSSRTSRRSPSSNRLNCPCSLGFPSSARSSFRRECSPILFC